MVLWDKWIVRGLLGWFVLLVSLRCFGCFMFCVNATVQWLPRAALAWVPGINIIWFAILVLGMGRLLSSESIEPVAQLWVIRLKRCPCLCSWCKCFSQLCLGRCGNTKKVAVPLQQGSGYRMGTVIGTFVRNEQTWCQVVYNGDGWLCWKASYIFLRDDLIDMDDFASQSLDMLQVTASDDSTIEESQ